MTIQISLTESVLKAIKTAAVPLVPGARSAHLSEAIAAGFGYKTNIALKTALRAGTVLATVADAAAAARLAELSAPLAVAPDFLSRAVRAALGAEQPRSLAPKRPEPSMRVGQLTLTARGLHREDGRSYELGSEEDLAAFLFTTQAAAGTALAIVFGEAPVPRLEIIGAEAQFDARKAQHAAWEQWSADVVVYRSVVASKAVDHAQRVTIARRLTAWAALACVTAQRLGMRDVIESADFLPLRHLVEHAWKAAFVTRASWEQYQERLSLGFVDNILGSLGHDGFEDAVDPRDKATPVALPWPGEICPEVTPCDTPLDTAVTMGNGDLWVEPSGIARTEFRRFPMRVVESSPGQFAQLIFGLELVELAKGWPVGKSLTGFVAQQLADGVHGVRVARHPTTEGVHHVFRVQPSKPPKLDDLGVFC